MEQDMFKKNELLNVKIETIKFYMSPTYRKRTNDNGWIVIRIEDDQLCYTFQTLNHLKNYNKIRIKYYNNFIIEIVSFQMYLLIILKLIFKVQHGKIINEKK